MQMLSLPTLAGVDLDDTSTTTVFNGPDGPYGDGTTATETLGGE